MPDIIREHFQIKQTIVTISAYERGHIEAAKRSIREQRSYLEAFILKDPFFALTLEPYDLGAEDAPDIVKQMIGATKMFEIGPMAAVAGVIAKLAVEAMIEEGAAFAIVDNGGDISVLNDRPVMVGIYAGASPIRNVAFEIPPRTSPLGIATSSGTVGPSISFGCADAATVISEDPCLADAAATALGNAVQADNRLEECFEAIDKPGIDGALVIRKDRLALWGNLPRLRRAQLRPDLITRA
jgi:ApbE superfamily uncharacterized protein (UPF0280 family)